MTLETKRTLLIVVLSVAIPSAILSLYAFIAAERGGVYEVTHSWCAYGPGGRYGAVEWEARTQNRHVAWETEFFFGPVRGSLPFSAPVAIIVITMLSSAPALVALLLRFKKQAHRQTD